MKALIRIGAIGIFNSALSMKTKKQQSGFTLLEIMVVVIIIAVVSGISILALQQATRRPFLGEAEKLQNWLQDLSERAIFEGTSYGIIQDGNELKGLVFYRQHWFPLQSPEGFAVSEQATLMFAASEGDPGIVGGTVNEDMLPGVIFNEVGIEPEEGLALAFDNETMRFDYVWNDETGSIDMLRVEP